MYYDRILKFGERFRERLSPVLVQGALDYVEFGGEGLAFEILCDHLCELDVSITEDEYHEAVKLALDMGFGLDVGPFMHLKHLRS